MDSEQRNLFMAIGLALVVLLLYQAFVLGPSMERERAEREAAEAAAATEQAVEDAAGVPLADTAPSGQMTLARDDVIAQSSRIAIETPALSGSLSLRGARVDDLQLLRYDVTLDDETPVTLFNPASANNAYYAFHGWTDATGGAGLPGPTTEWTQVGGGVLSPDNPVVLRYEAPNNLVFLRTIEVDEDYLFTVTDEVRNDTDAPVAIQNYGVVRRNGLPDELYNFFILHEGFVGVIDDTLVLRKYKRMRDDQTLQRDSVGGWVGITDKYWLAALIPGSDAPVQFEYRADKPGEDSNYFANYLREPTVIGAGETVRVTNQLFAGAKRAELLSEYRDDLGINKFDLAIDWGNFWFLTKPFFAVLHYFGEVTGNFGIAILLLTILVKAVFFPIANASYKAMARMKALQPEMQRLRELHKDDPQAQQKAVVQLYQKEKVNPLAGCLPLIPQMIVFYALYKTLFVTLEMRHAPFFGWIQDLSAPDPTSMWNLFGLLPFDPSNLPILGGVLAIGAWPLVMGITMAAMQSLNPPPPDKLQQRIFAFMPVIFTVILAPFAAGLVIYWTWNNILSFLQQYLIMRRQGVDTPIGKFLANRYQDAKDGRLLDWARGLVQRKPAGDSKS